MKAKKGMALVQVIIISAIIFAICGMLVKWSLQMTLTRNRAVQSIAGVAALERARAEMWGCLNDRGYPAGSCTPTTEQEQCVPPSVSVKFSGTLPNCLLSLSVTK